MNYSNQYCASMRFYSNSAARASSHSNQAANCMYEPYHTESRVDGQNSIHVRDNVTWRKSWDCSSL